MRAKVPRACAAHAETGQGDAVGVHVETLHGIVAAFEDIGLTCAFPTVAVTAEGMNDDGARRLKLPCFFRHQL